MKEMLLHSCCAPCASAVIERLLPDFELSLFYYNPNITDRHEYEFRLSELKRLLREAYPSVLLIEGSYEPERYLEAVSGLETEPEGGGRCELCFGLRLGETAKKAAELGFDCFDSTLSISPHKSYPLISSTGRKYAESCGVEYMGGDYKKNKGFERSVELSKKYSLYRQDFCGCRFSRRLEG